MWSGGVSTHWYRSQVICVQTVGNRLHYGHSPPSGLLLVYLLRIYHPSCRWQAVKRHAETHIKLVILCERMLERFPLAARVVCLEMFVVTLCEAINGSGFLEIQRQKRQNCFLCCCCCFLFLPTTAFY